MNRRSVLFFLNFYNDVDHAAPLIKDLLDKDCKVHVICNSDYAIDRDVRFRFLQEHSLFHYHKLGLLPRTGGLSNAERRPLNLSKRLFREIIFNKFWALGFLLIHGISCVVYTWGRPTAKGVQRRFFEGSRIAGIRSICIPHGQNIFLNYDVNTSLRKNFREHQRWPDFSDRNAFDLYIVQTEHHLDQHIAFGMDRKTLRAYGSLRFSPDWIEFNRKLLSLDKPSQVKSGSKTHLVFFLPHWRYNTSYESTLSLILRLSEINRLVLTVKGHTRGDDLDNETISLLKNKDNIIWARPNDESPALIESSDLVVNFGSSIAYEAILTGIPVIYPKYLHSNTTVFDSFAVVNVAESESEAVALVHRGSTSSLSPPAPDELSRFADEEIYNHGDCSIVRQRYLSAVINPPT